jgi:transposase
VGCVGIEGTSSYGAGLARYLRCTEIPVVEVERPKLRRNGKSDPIDAEAAARTVWPETLRAVKGWLEPSIMLNRYWGGFCGKPDRRS